MIKIEKIHNPLENHILENVEGSSQGHPLPGYVDFFCSNRKTYYWDRYSDVYKNFNDCIPKNVSIGKKYGLQGIKYSQLISSEPDDTLFEICYEHLERLPERFLKSIVENHRILLCDFLEGGMFALRHKHFINNLYHDYNVREIIQHNSGFKFGLITYACSMKKDFVYNPSKLAIVLARKPRRTRVDFLNKMHQTDILKECDWSLYYDVENRIEPDKETTPFRKMQQFNLAEYPNLKVEYPDFFNSYKSILPKSLNNKTVKNLHNTNMDLDYKFFISLEPEGDEHFNPLLGIVDDIFITEKTFKAFGAGIPCMIYGKAGIESKLKNVGFKFYFDNYDHLERQERIDVMVTCLQQEHDINKLKEIALHNYNLFWNKDFLVDLSLRDLYEN